MTELVNKAGKFIIQDYGKKGKEATYLALFTCSTEGEEWMKQNHITKKLSSESPDFLFKVQNNKTIGLEIVNLIVKSDKFFATARLESIAKKIVNHFKKQDIQLTIILEIYDHRKYSPYYKEMVDRRNNPGFKHLNASDKEIKDEIIKALEEEGIKSWDLTRKWVDIGGQTFYVNASRFHEPHTSCHVNNEGMCIEDPFEDLKKTIDRKNEKFASYKKSCDECDLLIVSDENFTYFTSKLKSHKFESLFRNVYFMDLSGGVKTTKLEII